MSTVEEIEDAVRRLSARELEAFRSWFADYDAAVWDRQIEQDIASRRLDRFAEEALKVLREAHCTGAVRHFASPRFWRYYAQLPNEVRRLAESSPAEYDELIGMA